VASFVSYVATALPVN